jgi:uncharacterized protein (TIGR01777 family)
MRVTVTGATGLIGRRVVAALLERGDAVTVLSRDPERAKARQGRPDSGTAHADSPTTTRWDPISEPAPRAALAGADAVVHLAGENVAQRWTDSAKREIRESRVLGTRNLVLGIEALAETERPKVLVSGSAIGYYGAHGDEPIDEESPPGKDFLAQTCAQWETEAEMATRLGIRVVKVRTGVVLDSEGGALGKMLPPASCSPRSMGNNGAGLSTPPPPSPSATATSQKRLDVPCTALRCCRCPARPCD